MVVVLCGMKQYRQLHRLARDPGQEDDEEEGDEADRDDRLEFEEFMREIQNNPRAGHPAGPKT